MAVSAIPEGLPAVITVTLAVGVSRMAKRNAIIRKLDAVEALGSVTAICTDKTGTLTTNQMTVQKIFLGKGMVDVSGAGFRPLGEFEMDGARIDAARDPDLSRFLQIAALCNDSVLKASEDGDGERWEVLGDPTEGALAAVAAKAGLDRDRLAEDHPRIEEIPFDSSKKYMATIHRIPEERAVAYLKGAPEVILGFSSDILVDGQVEKLDQNRKEDLLRASGGMAEGALRVLAMAYRELDEADLGAFKDAGSKDLVFAGFSGMIDPPGPRR